MFRRVLTGRGLLRANGERRGECRAAETGYELSAGPLLSDHPRRLFNCRSFQKAVKVSERGWTIRSTVFPNQLAKKIPNRPDNVCV
jgi:hypothetical protein